MDNYPVVSFVGWHNSGKTSIVRKISVELKSRGYSIGILKSSHHHDLSIHKKNSDTEHYRNDGIPYVAIAGPDECILWMDREKYSPMHLAFRLFPDADMVICEGFKYDPELPKILVASQDGPDILNEDISGVIAVIGAKSRKQVPGFSTEDISGLADFLEKKIIAERQRKDGPIYLFVNGRHITMKRYVRRSLKGIITGFIEPLRGVADSDNIQNIEIRIIERK